MIKIKSVKKSDLYKLIEISKDVFANCTSKEDFEKYLNEDTIKIWEISNKKIIKFVI